MYYVLDCEFPLNENGEALVEVHNSFKVGKVRNWRNGQRLKPGIVVPTPIEIEFERHRGYAGQPPELIDSGVPVMTTRLADALQESGVDNIDFFPAILSEKSTGEKFDYKAYKVVGLVSAADMGKSDWSSYDNRPVIDVSFDGIEIDLKKTGGLLLFRLAENINALLVHQHIKDLVEKKGIDTLQFLDPTEWVQI